MSYDLADYFMGIFGFVPVKCPRDGTRLERGKAMQSTLVDGSPDMGEVVTMYEGGPGKIVDCWKCPHCGYSIR